MKLLLPTSNKYFSNVIRFYKLRLKFVMGKDVRRKYILQVHCVTIKYPQENNTQITRHYMLSDIFYLSLKYNSGVMSETIDVSVSYQKIQNDLYLYLLMLTDMYLELIQKVHVAVSCCGKRILYLISRLYGYKTLITQYNDIKCIM